MPYIDKNSRAKFDSHSLDLIGVTCENPGDLNFVLTSIIHGYLNRRGLMKYQDINDVIGALEGAKLELYRRVASGYEDKKIEQNGDV